ncbi:MAG: DUF2852 domain-containing protein [Pseudomonadota bacterium]
MTTAATHRMQGWVETVDQYGKGAWIALMVLGFIVFWPIGLATLAFLIWSGRMGSNKQQWSARAWGRKARFTMDMRPSGNSAFDEYREETLRRLEEEQEEFESFLENLRKAKDKAEFDQFMDERQRHSRARPNAPEDEAVV